MSDRFYTEKAQCNESFRNSGRFSTEKAQCNDDFRMSGRIDLKALKRIDGRGFSEELGVARECLTKSEAKEFFKVVLSHFEYEIPVKAGAQILKTIGDVVKDQRIMGVFEDGGFMLSLPFSQKEFSEPLFELLAKLARLNPNLFDADVAVSCRKPFRRDGESGLKVIAELAVRLEDFEDPMPMFELLIDEAESFASIIQVNLYVAVLGQVLSGCREFKKLYASKAIRIIAQIMKQVEVELVALCYTGIGKLPADLSLPVEMINKHLKNPKLQASVLSYTVVNPPLDADEILIDKLLELASDGEQKATYSLYQIAADKNGAQVILGNPDWIRMGLPSGEDTLRLLLVLFQHRRLRPEIAQMKYFVKFLHSVVDETNDTNVITSICTMLRRVNMDEDMVARMSENGFIRAYFDKALQIGEDLAVHSGFLLCDTIARICYTKELSPMCSVLADYAKEGGVLSNVAAQVAVDLAQYDRCLDKLVDKRMDAFFEKKQKDKKLGQAAREFLSLLR